MLTDKPDIREWRKSLGLSQAKLAEITGIPQHLLSAHELGKCELNAATLAEIFHLDRKAHVIKEISRRKKRYQEHEYCTVAHDPLRLKKYFRTAGNFVYLEALHSLCANSQDTSLTALSLFSGCGGLSLGFKAAGFRIKGFLEIDPNLRNIYAQNFPCSLEIGSDIRMFRDDDIEALSRRIGQVDIIIGGPPCQGFSLAGKRETDDPRNVLFKDYLRFVKFFRPKMAILENVRLLGSMKNASNGFIKDDIRESFSLHGYSVKAFEINAKDYGVPQHRERLIFVAVDKSYGISPSIPQPLFTKNETFIPQMQIYRTFADACSDLKYLESGESDPSDALHSAVSHPKHVIDWLWEVPEGYSAHDNTDPTKRPPSGYNTTYKRQVWLQPASTVQTTFGMISGCRNVHPIATRALTIREAARIQSFPDQYKFSGSSGVIRTGIGNAVPPLLAFEIAKHVRSIISNFIKISSFKIEL